MIPDLTSDNKFMEQILAYGVLFGAGQALVLGASLPLRTTRAPGQGVLAILLVTIAIWQTQTALGLLNAPVQALAWWGLLHFPAACAFGPLLLAYGNRLIQPGYDDRLALWSAGCLALTALGAELWILFGLVGTDWQTVAAATWSHLPGAAEDARLALLSLVPRPLATLAAAWIILRAVFTKPDGDPQRRRVRAGLIGLGLVAAIATAISFLAQTTGHLRGSTHAFGALLTTFGVCGLYLVGQRLPAFLDGAPWRSNRRSRLDGIDGDWLIRRIEFLMKTERIYRTEDLSLAALAAAISEDGGRVSPEQLSGFINARFGQNFNRFVNGYRIQEACERLRAEPERSVLSIALDAGFNSKSSFNAAFKQATGVSPQVYRRGV